MLINQMVKSNLTGITYRVIGYDEPTLLGQKVVMLQSMSDPNNIFPSLVEGLTELYESDSSF